MDGSFTFFQSFQDAIESIPTDSGKLEAYQSIISYGLTREEPVEFNEAIAKAIFIMAKPNIDASEKRRAGGRKGGLSKPTEKNKQACNNSKASLQKENKLAYKQEQASLKKNDKLAYDNSEASLQKENKIAYEKSQVSLAESASDIDIDKDIDIEKDIDKELDIEKESYEPTGDNKLLEDNKKLLKALLRQYSISEKDLLNNFKSKELAYTFGEWLECRSQRKEMYPPAAMADDLSRARQGEEKYGAKAVIEILKASFSYMRPIWDKLDKAKPTIQKNSESGTDYLLRRISEEEAKEASE